MFATDRFFCCLLPGYHSMASVYILGTTVMLPDYQEYRSLDSPFQDEPRASTVLTFFALGHDCGCVGASVARSSIDTTTTGSA